MERRVERELKALPYSTPTVKQDVNPNVVAYVLERQDEFPGVEPERESLREYPHGVIGAHLFGTVGEVSPQELKDTRYQRRVGWATASASPASRPSTTASCAGANGAARVQVDALGNLTKTLRRGAAGARASSCGCRST